LQIIKTNCCFWHIWSVSIKALNLQLTAIFLRKKYFSLFGNPVSAPMLLKGLSTRLKRTTGCTNWQSLIRGWTSYIYKTVICFLYIYFNFKFFPRYCKKVASFFVNGATLLQMSIEVTKYPLTTTLEGNQYSRQGSESVYNLLTNMYCLQKLPIHLWGIYQRDASNL
jgi:hypothetical protein